MIHLFGQNRKNNYYPDDDDDFELNACSMQDCTGLIPSLVQNEAEVEAYEDIYPYIPPNVPAPPKKHKKK